jgi:hypothetical protein
MSFTRRRPPTVNCHESTSWSSTGASGAPWRPRTRAPGPSRPTPTPSGSSPPTARPTATRLSPAYSSASTSRRSSPTSWPAGSRPPHTTATGPARLLQVGGGRGRPPVQPHGRDETAAAARATGGSGSARTSGSAAQDPRGAGLCQPPRHRHHPPAGRYRDAPGRVRRHEHRRCRPGPAHRLGAGQGSTTSGATDRPQDRPGTGPLPAGPRVPPAGPPGAALDRPQRTHDPVGCRPGGPRPGPGRWATGDASASAPACLRHQLAS